MPANQPTMDIYRKEFERVSFGWPNVHDNCRGGPGVRGLTGRRFGERARHVLAVGCRREPRQATGRYATSSADAVCLGESPETVASARIVPGFLDRDLPGLSWIAALKKQDYRAGKVGKTVYSKSRKNLPIGRPKRTFNRERVIELRQRGASIRAIAKQLGVGVGTVTRTLLERSKTS